MTAVPRLQPASNGRTVVPSLRHPSQEQPDPAGMWTALGRLWLSGGDVDWDGFYAGGQRPRVPLPSYPFEPRRCWIDPDKVTGTRVATEWHRQPIDDSFYVPSWRHAPGTYGASTPAIERSPWLIFADDRGVGAALGTALVEAGHTVTTVRPGDSFARLDDSAFTIGPRQRGAFDAVLDALAADGRLPKTVIHMWGIPAEAPSNASDAVHAALDRGFYSFLFTAQALARHQAAGPVRLYALANHTQAVIGDEPINPAKAAVLGACKVIPKEIMTLSCHTIDLQLPVAPSDDAAIARALLAELCAEHPDETVAFRGRKRWVAGYESVHPSPEASLPNRLKEHGVYLITGGRGRGGGWSGGCRGCRAIAEGGRHLDAGGDLRRVPARLLPPLLVDHDGVRRLRTGGLCCRQRIPRRLCPKPRRSSDLDGRRQLAGLAGGWHGGGDDGHAGGAPPWRPWRAFRSGRTSASRRAPDQGRGGRGRVSVRLLAVHPLGPQ